jgi:hypothetical protein
MIAYLNFFSRESSNEKEKQDAVDDFIHSLNFDMCYNGIN